MYLCFQEVSQVTWHGKGDYFATVMHEGGRMAVLIHLLSKRHSQVGQPAWPGGKALGW